MTKICWYWRLRSVRARENKHTSPNTGTVRDVWTGTREYTCLFGESTLLEVAVDFKQNNQPHGNLSPPCLPTHVSSKDRNTHKPIPAVCGQRVLSNYRKCPNWLSAQGKNNSGRDETQTYGLDCSLPAGPDVGSFGQHDLTRPYQ
ncbi:hypothetical protein PoB_004206000 [Plakobranchus ocellatus]|uniref:Uncharacterized protein n=1 Tax=Plakobranchus ocellatus TaxID=259542 RepID=A0AAV4B8X9_9GAST|nr:hypothetical protein PoB_004206000 [Plakobranchus ocellatus]